MVSSCFTALHGQSLSAGRSTRHDLFHRCRCCNLLNQALRFACCIRKSLAIARKHWRMTRFRHSASLTPSLAHVVTVRQETDQIHLRCNLVACTVHTNRKGMVLNLFLLGIKMQPIEDPKCCHLNPCSCDSLWPQNRRATHTCNLHSDSIRLPYKVVTRE